MRRFTLATMAGVLMGLGISASSSAAPGGASVQRMVYTHWGMSLPGPQQSRLWKTKMAGIAVA